MSLKLREMAFLIRNAECGIEIAELKGRSEAKGEWLSEFVIRNS